MGVIETSRSAAQKMLLTKQMTQIVEACSPIWDRWLTEAMRDSGALGGDVVALAETYSPTRFQQRAGAFGLSAGVAMDLRLVTRSRPGKVEC